MNTLISRTDWGIVTSAAPEIFPSSDVSQETVDLTLKWFNIAAAEWGNYGPVELYIVGNDAEAARNLEDAYCQRHRALDPKWEVEWDCANSNYAIFTGRVWRIRTAQPAMLALLLLVVRFYLGLIVLAFPNTKDCA